MESIQGRALVASPYLTDPNFLRAVVYILRHDDEGALGLILNRPTHTTIGSLLGELTNSPIENGQSVYCGGPVDGPLMMLQESCDDDGASRLYVASDQERILRICSASMLSSDAKYRVFDGYAGWGTGQLDAELKHGGWLVWDIQPQQLFGDPNWLWKEAIQQIGRDILAGGIDPAKMPKDPAYN